MPEDLASENLYGNKVRKAVVTGGAGFIGSHLAEELARKSYYIIILDNLSTGKKENIEPLLKRGGAEFIEGSITNLPRLQRLSQGISYVFHLAAISNVPLSVENPQVTHEVNATGTLNILLAARDNVVRKAIYASSAAVYGDTLTLPKKEDMLPCPNLPML